jgi:hypothetical protein
MSGKSENRSPPDSTASRKASTSAMISDPLIGCKKGLSAQEGDSMPRIVNEKISTSVLLTLRREDAVG